MKEEWLFPGATVPVDAETTTVLVAEIKRLIGVVGDMALAINGMTLKHRLDQGPDYERGFIDGMQKQMQSSVDKAVNAMAQDKRPWVGLTDEQREECTQSPFTEDNYDDIEAKLKELNT